MTPASRPNGLEAIAKANSRLPGGRLLGRVGDGEPLTATRTTSRDDLAAALGLHARTEAVRLLTVAVSGAKCDAHDGLAGWEKRPSERPRKDWAI